MLVVDWSSLRPVLPYTFHLENQCVFYVIHFCIFATTLHIAVYIIVLKARLLSQTIFQLPKKGNQGARSCQS